MSQVNVSDSCRMEWKDQWRANSDFHYGKENVKSGSVIVFSYKPGQARLSSAYYYISENLGYYGNIRATFGPEF